MISYVPIPSLEGIPAHAKLADIARAAGVSVATASRALSRPDMVAEATRILVQEAAARADYRPNLVARSLRTQSTASIFVLVPELTGSLVPETLRGLDWAAHARGYSLMLGITGPEAGRKASYVDMAYRQRADGLIAINGLLDGFDLPSAIQDLPCVQVLDDLAGSTRPCVTIDEHEAAATATRHLLALGHRRIGCLCGLPDQQTARLRKQGYATALAEAGLVPDPSIQLSGIELPSNGPQAVSQLLSAANRPTAVICGSGEMAQLALLGITQAGLRVPEDISVIGLDAAENAGGSGPSLTTINVPYFDLGAAAMSMLLDIIAGTPVPSQHVVIPASLIPGSTTAPVPGTP